MKYLIGLAACFALVALAIPVSAQSIDPPLWWTVDGGGVVISTGLYTLGATAGQPDAATVSRGLYSLEGGYWPGGSLYESLWTAGQRAIVDGLAALMGLLGLRTLYDLVRQWMH